MKPYYQDEAVIIYHGDCVEVMRSLEAQSVDAVITDPPYFQPATHYVPTRTEGAARKTLADTSILQHFFSAFISECVRVMRSDGSVYVFCDGQSYPIAFTALYPLVKRVRPIVWDKIASFNGYTWRHQHELIAWGEMEETPRIATGDGDIIRCAAVPVGERLHPAQKPIELIAKLVDKTPAGAVIIDPFCGSASTGVAAARAGRKFIGVELDPNYCDIAVQRMRDAPSALSAQAVLNFYEAKPATA
jgi:DNA modification methylase